MKKLSEKETESLLKRYRIPAPKSGLARTEDAAAKLAKKLGYPVVMKIESPDIIHKTDAKCVILNLKTEETLRTAFRQIHKNARKHKRNAKILGVQIFEMVQQGTREVIIGAKEDPQFGPVLMFGLGGILVEVMKDVSFRVIPLERKDAKAMIREIRGFKILEGVRGQGPINFKLLEDTILKVSSMVEKTKKIKELDINPLFISDKAWAADVRVFV